MMRRMFAALALITACSFADADVSTDYRPEGTSVDAFTGGKSSAFEEGRSSSASSDGKPTVASSSGPTSTSLVLGGLALLAFLAVRRREQ